MTIKGRRCPCCKGEGIINENKATNARKICPVCEGLGTPVYDEDFDNAKSFLGDDDDIYIDLDEDE